MYNDIITIGPVTIHGYGLMVAIGILTAILLSSYRAKKLGLNPDFIYDVAFTAVIGGGIGSKLLYFIVEIDEIIKDPSIILDFANGWVVYGGIIGGVVASYIYCRIRKNDFFKYFDLVMPSVAIAQGFGRIGCLLAGCCYGRETTSHFGIIFHNSQFAPNGVRLIPTQIISSAGDFIIGIVLIYMSKKFKKDGQTGVLYFILYGIGRFIIEFYRNDFRGSVGDLSTSQFISIFMVIAGIIGLYVLGRKKKDTLDTL